MERPDYVRCVLTGRADEKKTWCGRIPDVFESTFVDATHAILNAANEGYSLICPECSRKMAEALAKGTYSAS